MVISNRSMRSVSAVRCALHLILAVALAANFISSVRQARADATIVVATKDSSERSKSTAQFVGDGEGDQQEIIAAIRALPEVGGTVQLMEGTYDIRKVPGQLGGIIIDRSHVVLAGMGTSTKLIQAPNQDTNVIRIIGSGIGQITIRDLYVDANRDQNTGGKGDPNVSHDRFEFCGIKAFYRVPGGSGGEPNHDITIENTYVLDAWRLGIMLEGSNMKVLNNVLGNAGSDSVEILAGPGVIRGNYVEITGRTHVAIGSDRGDNIIMTGNVVRVKKGGDLDIGFRSWAESRRHVITGNVLTVDPGGKCGLAMDIRGTGAVVTGNAIHTSDAEKRLPLRITGGNTLVTGNLFENVVLVVNEKTGENKPIVISGNILEKSSVDHREGNLEAPDTAVK